MSHRPFRFLHTSDFRLDAVPRGLAEAPDHLRDKLLDAPYDAARRVFDIALAERVAFVILAGNVLQPDLAGPRGTAFLLEQFQRLAEAGIGVYWAGGESDPPEAWPAAFPLPENVRVFAKDHITDVLHQYDGSPLARITGASRHPLVAAPADPSGNHVPLIGESTNGAARTLHPADFSPDAVGLFSIGVVCGEVEAAGQRSNAERLEGISATVGRLQGDHATAERLEGSSTTVERLEGDHATAERLEASSTAAELQARGMHYWALGGRTERGTLFQSPGIAHYPGTTQGRSPAESGARGCTVVDVDDQCRARMSYLATSAMEWRQETVLVDSATRREGLEAIFTQRIHGLIAESKTDRLVTWTIGGNGPLLGELHRGKLRGELLEWLRIEHGLSSPVVWTVGIELATQNALPPGLYEQETILGDFLRGLRELEIDPARPLNLESLLPDGPAGQFAQKVAIADVATRKRILHEAAMLAVELLGGHGGQYVMHSKFEFPRCAGAVRAWSAGGKMIGWL